MAVDILVLIDRLIAISPDCFNRQAPKPLKIGIGPELLAQVGTHPELMDVSRKQIRQALAFYTGANSYLRAVAKGGPRYGLDGQPSGEVAPDQQDFAKRKKKGLAALSSDPGSGAAVDMIALLQEVMAMAIPARLDVTIKINELPQSKATSSQTVLFAIKANNRTVVVELKSKSWKNFKELTGRYRHWVASITGQPGEALPDGGFKLENPAVQVFEMKPKGDTVTPTAMPSTLTPAAPPPEGKSPTPTGVPKAVDTPPADPVVSPPSPVLQRPRLSLKNRGS